MTRVVAVDPGRSKCGLVLVDVNQSLVVEGGVRLASDVEALLSSWCTDSAGVDRILLGDGTSSAEWLNRLQTLASVQLVDETGTTLRARDRYWQLWPPQGWRRLIPRGLLLPPGDLDALAALVMLEQSLNITCRWPTNSPPIRSEPEQ